ncbi:MAG: asparagine synthase (glutamine-hydrolyzing) [Bacteroidetes bacterium]|nr:asparagine synthase (glutamine-hydrolyzing) [Bacteroidota bacterium]
MCGITGIAGIHSDPEKRRSAVKAMTDSISHRGPDAEGIWQDHDVCLGHRRLSIIDLSEAGNQPFFSQDNRYVIVYNGELYNFRELKLELQRAQFGSGQVPYIFKTNTDTEVILVAYMRWGKECLNYFNGMFAFAIWDTQEKHLFVVRDRLGVKPLYYSFINGQFIFASEIRAMLNSGCISRKLSATSVAEYIQYQTVHAPNTILEDVKMLMPGYYLEFSGAKLSATQYWNINQYTKSKEDLTYQQTCEGVNQLLTESVERRLVADVPFGAFLSGGIDSSAVVGLMSKVSSEPVETFHVSFDEREFSEAHYASLISKRFHTKHHEIRLKPSDFLAQLPEALAAIDHPTGDGPNTYIVSKATRQAGITMALSGLGGDELFAGYDIFKRFYELDKKSWLNAAPRFMRSMAGSVISQRKKSVQGDKTAEILSAPHIDGLNAYPVNRKLFNPKDYAALMGKSSDDSKYLRERLKHIQTDKEHVLSRCSLYEIQTYMQNVLLRDTDQMSMAVALEVREPFLDYKLVEFALGVKDEYKYPHTPKKLLVDALVDLLPPEIINRPKMGFSLPWKEWLKNELRDFCENNLVEFSKRGIVDRGVLLDLWNRFLANDPKITWSRLWHIVVLNHWMKLNQVEN